MPTRSAGVAVSACLFIFMTAHTALSGQLPPPDYNAIEKAAQRVDDDREYRDSLPDRLGECMKTSEAYASSWSTDDNVEATFIQEACLRAMMQKLQQLYFVREAFGPGGIDARIEELKKPLETMFHDFSVMGPECGGRACGSIADAIAPRDQYVSFLRDLTELMAIYAAGKHGQAKFHDAWMKAAQFEWP